MDSFDELKTLWNETALPTLLQISEIKRKADDYRKKKVTKAFFGILMLASVFLVLGYVIANYDAAYQSTYIGIVAISLAIAGAILWQISGLNLLSKPVDDSIDNKSYLLRWQKYQAWQVWGQGLGISLYFILLSIGLALYIFEFAQRNWHYGIFFYAITFIWMALNWFYFRPRIIKKQTKDMNAVLDELRRISEQLLTKI